MIDMQHCPVCGSDQRKTIRRATFDPLTIDSSDFRITDNRYGQCWTFKRCLSCRMVYADPAPQAEDLIRFYSGLDDGEYGQEADGRAQNFHTILNALSKMPLGGKRLLDIGSANGLFVYLARQEGYLAEGIEPAASLVNEAEKRYGIELFNGTLDGFPRQSESWDIVTLLDLIEHIADPAAFLRQVNGLMSDGGLLVIVTPDIDSLAARLMQRRWWHHRIAHIQFFPLKTMNRLLQDCGFEIEMKRRYAWHFSSLYLVSRLIPQRFLPSGLQKVLKKINLKVQLFDSWEIYATKKRSLP